MNSFRNYDIPKMLYFHNNLYRPSQQGLLWKIKKIIRLLLNIVIKRYSLLYQYGGNKILYVDRTLTDRADISIMLGNLFNLLDNRVDRLQWELSYKFLLTRMVSNILFCSQMMYLLKQYKFMEWVYAMGLFVEMRDVEEEMNKKVEIEKYNLCFCFYDAAPFQNFLIQYAKKHGRKTATLQHGIMLSPRLELSDNVDFMGHEFKASVSDFFLAWNEFTKQEAIKTGIDKDKLKVIGVSKCIGVEPPTYAPNSNVVGIILDGKFEDQNNIPMIQIIQKWAKNNSYKCIFRYHPDYKSTEFDEYIDSSISEVCNKSVSLYEFINKISFCIVANSTVLFELEYFCIPFIRYSSNDLFDKFRDYHSFTFTSDKDIEKAYKEMRNTPQKTFVSADINYLTFFKQFIN